MLWQISSIGAAWLRNPSWWRMFPTNRNWSINIEQAIRHKKWNISLKNGRISTTNFNKIFERSEKNGQITNPSNKMLISTSTNKIQKDHLLFHWVIFQPHLMLSYFHSRKHFLSSSLLLFWIQTSLLWKQNVANTQRRNEMSELFS